MGSGVAFAFRTMEAHAELDPSHGDELYELVDSLALTREQAGVVGLSAMHTVDLYARAIEEILDDAGPA